MVNAIVLYVKITYEFFFGSVLFNLLETALVRTN